MQNTLVSKWSLHVIGLVIAVMTVFPLLWMALTGFKNKTEALRVPLQLFPEKWLYANYISLLQDVMFMRVFFNTFLVAVIGVVFSLLLNSMAAYAFARIEFPGKKLLFPYIIMTMFIPGISVLLPSFLLIVKLGLLNTYAALIIPGLAWAYGFFFLRQYYLAIPVSMDEAALIDGAGRFRTYIYIFLPMSKPVFTLLGISVFLGYWNSFLWPVLVISDDSKFQIMQYLRFFYGQYSRDWPLIMAGAALSSIPTITLFAIFQRYLIQGIKISGIK